MKKENEQIEKDTICAIATGSASANSGGLGVIRVSGPCALEVLQRIFRPKNKIDEMHYNFAFKPRYMHYGFFVMPNDKKENFILDEVLAIYFQDPFSYTGEELVEIQVHGGSALLYNMLEYILSLSSDRASEFSVSGIVRHADAGEFTKRAFLNGRIDLSQAEAVSEIISAPAVEGVRLAAAKLAGGLGKRIENLREQMEYLRQRLCLAIDFPEEEGECLPKQEFHALLDVLQADLSQLISAYDRARPWSEGSLVVLAGQVNAGKSSLMNAILGRKRAIVTAEAGTTRDYLEENTFLNGLSVRLTDTAGLREIKWLVQEMQSRLADLAEFSKKSKKKEVNDDDEAFSGLNAQILERLSHALNENFGDENFGDVKKKTKKASGKKKASNLIAQENPISSIEAEGICRSLELMENADLILLVFDGVELSEKYQEYIDNFDKNASKNIKKEKIAVLADFMQSELNLLPKHAKKICVWNKADKALLETEARKDIEKILDTPLFCMSARHIHSLNPMIRRENEESISEKTKKISSVNTKSEHVQSIAELALFARNLLVRSDTVMDEIAPNRRQAGLLTKAQKELDLLQVELDFLPSDLISVRLEVAMQLLAAITGVSTVDETFNAIFEDFCIGK